jgi:GntR family transcriptional regulator / MocR family aminotransferase
MARTAGVAPLLLTLDPAKREPLHRQVYRELRRAILDGRLAPGARLPSSRALAQDLQLSRNTVLQAFEQLVVEGLLEGRVGSGTRVATALERPGGRREASPRAGGPPPSARARALLAVPRRASLVEGTARAFTPGIPVYDDFPRAVWAALASRCWRRGGRALLDGGPAAGDPELRVALAEYLGRVRGVRCEPGQVLIVSGSQQALDLSGRVLLDPGDAAWIEDPGYHFARGALVAAGATLVPVPLDEEGMCVAVGRAAAPAARLAYVSPSHQFPTGVTLSLARRLALLRWARETRAFVLEDDYDSEFRYAQRPLAALQGLDTEGRVVYTGSFSKVLFPGLRLGYLVAPPGLVDAFLAARTFADGGPPSASQATLAAFLAEGHFERHVRRVRASARERQDVLLEAAHRDLRGLLEVSPADAGMHVVGWLPPGRSGAEVQRKAAARGVDALPVSFFALRKPARDGLVLGYAGLSPREIRAGVQALARALASSTFGPGAR